MPGIMPHELVRVAEKLEKVFGNFIVIVKVGLPNVIALSPPNDRSLKDEGAVLEFGYQSLKAAGINLHTRLEMVFISPDQTLISIVLEGPPRDELN